MSFEEKFKEEMKEINDLFDNHPDAKQFSEDMVGATVALINAEQSAKYAESTQLAAIIFAATSILKHAFLNKNIPMPKIPAADLSSMSRFIFILLNEWADDKTKPKNETHDHLKDFVKFAKGDIH